MSLDPAPEQLLVCVRPVDIGRVKECDAELERAMNGRERFFIVASAVKVGHAHATEPDRGNDWTAAAEFALFHIGKALTSILSLRERRMTKSPVRGKEWASERRTTSRLVRVAIILRN